MRSPIKLNLRARTFAKAACRVAANNTGAVGSVLVDVSAMFPFETWSHNGKDRRIGIGGAPQAHRRERLDTIRSSRVAVAP
jgi:hypothetical protein